MTYEATVPAASISMARSLARTRSARCSIALWKAQRFTVFVDYPHDRLLLKPNESFNTPFEPDKSGLALIAEGKIRARGRAAPFARDSGRGAARTVSPAQQSDSLRILRGGEILNLTLTTRRVI